MFLESRKCYSNHTVTQILTITGKTFSYSSLAELKYKTLVNKTFDYQFIFTFEVQQQHILITPPSIINFTLKQPHSALSCYLYKNLYKQQLQKPEVSACNLNLPFTPNTNFKFLSKKNRCYSFFHEYKVKKKLPSCCDINQCHAQTSKSCKIKYSNFKSNIVTLQNIQLNMTHIIFLLLINFLLIT